MKENSRKAHTTCRVTMNQCVTQIDVYIYIFFFFSRNIYPLLTYPWHQPFDSLFLLHQKTQTLNIIVKKKIIFLYVQMTTTN